MNDYPDDADGHALRRVAAESDMSRPMVIDFFVAVPDQQSGERIAKAADAAGYRPRLDQDEESGQWTCYCSKQMLADHAGVLAAQRELAVIADTVDGCDVDGWGTFGNKEGG